MAANWRNFPSMLAARVVRQGAWQSARVRRSAAAQHGVDALMGVWGRREEERKSELRSFHTTSRAEVTPLLIGIGVATTALAAQYGLRVRGGPVAAPRARGADGVHLTRVPRRFAGLREVAGVEEAHAEAGRRTSFQAVL